MVRNELRKAAPFISMDSDARLTKEGGVLLARREASGDRTVGAFLEVLGFEILVSDLLYRSHDTQSTLRQFQGIICCSILSTRQIRASLTPSLVDLTFSVIYARS